MNTFPSALGGAGVVEKGLLVNAVDPRSAGCFCVGRRERGRRRRCGRSRRCFRRRRWCRGPVRVRSRDVVVRRVPAREGFRGGSAVRVRAVEVVDLALDASEDRVGGEPGPGGGRCGRGAGSFGWDVGEGERERAVHRRGEPLTQRYTTRWCAYLASIVVRDVPVACRTRLVHLRCMVLVSYDTTTPRR